MNHPTESPNVVCPYYAYEGRNRIICEGPEGFETTCFISSVEKRKHKHRACMTFNYCENCRVADETEKGYEEIDHEKMSIVRKRTESKRIPSFVV